MKQFELIDDAYREMDSFRKNNLTSVQNGHFRPFVPEFQARKWLNERRSYINFEEKISVVSRAFIRVSRALKSYSVH